MFSTSCFRTIYCIMKLLTFYMFLKQDKVSPPFSSTSGLFCIKTRLLDGRNHVTSA